MVWNITDGLSEWPGRRKEEEDPKWSGKSDETEEFNTWRRSKPAAMTKTDWETVTGVTLENNNTPDNINNISFFSVSAKKRGKHKKTIVL
jgi:hypothetical protein